MEQEKDKGFKVTDKRSAFKEETPEQEKGEASPEAAKQPKEPKQEKKEPPSDQGSPPPLLEASLLTLLFSLYTHAQICLGFIPDPLSQKPQKDLQQAKYNIDMLDVLKEKTKGNLTKEEEQALDNILYELHMGFVEASK